ncbi:MAG TPA: aminotransferase class I/II-fold pyridoxal phosphate-dependent enzyme [Solirubrobacteraceae bacterium]|jgi:DNA-binding transcriptional MocR family regulator|nr:aminotransferase class I/II-fold pyridoxal phosphate-dependent enzyme [Solirubrobacteraceae bacterium]
MDPEVARTLNELERKIEELERTLSSVTAPERHPQASPLAAHPSQVHAPPWSRVVDERIEAAAAPPVTPRSPTPTRSPTLRQPSPPLPGPPLRRPAPTHSRGGAPPPPRPEELLRFRDRLERTARELTHDYDELLGRISYAAVSSAPGPTISFARGAPSLDIVDVDGLRDAAVRAFESDPAGTTAYGTSIGYPRLRSWIADRHGVEPERVLVTNGSMQADAFLFEHLVRPGDDVVVERPSYDRTLLSLRQRGARLHAVELEPDGIDTQALERLLEGGAPVQPKLAHIIPNFQNPAGYTISQAKREALLQLAARHDFVVFEDDPYVALRFSGETLPTMLSMDPERVVYASSFSKTVCPGIRVGYLVGPPELIKAIAQLATNTYISPNMVSQSIVYEFCASGAIDRSIETVKAALAERASTLAQALKRDLPEAEFVEPQGGYFMWVTLPEGTDVHALFQAAADRGVSFVKGTDFLLEGGENTLRLAYSGVTPEQVDAGVGRLAEAYRSL